MSFRNACFLAAFLTAATTTSLPAVQPSDKVPLPLSREHVEAKAADIDAAIEKLFDHPVVKAPMPPLADDAVFLRRAYLGIAGRLPSAAEARKFLDDPSPEKRAQLVDDLLAVPESSEHLFLQFADLLHLRDEVLGASQKPYIDWVRESLHANMPYDALVRAMITASGTLAENPASGWLMAGEGNVVPAVLEMSGTWLGTNLGCAACHDSPFSDRTQMEFYRLAASFGGLQLMRKTADGHEAPVSKKLPPKPSAPLMLKDTGRLTVTLPEDYAYRDGRPGMLVSPTLPNFSPYRSASPSQGAAMFPPPRESGPVRAPADLRAKLADWVTRSNEDAFSTMIAARLWTMMVGGSDAFALDARDLQEPGPLQGINDYAFTISLMTHASAVAWSWGCHIDNSTVNTLRALGSRSFDLPERNENPFLHVLGDVMRSVGYDLREFRRVLWNTRIAQREATPDVEALGASPYRTINYTPASPLIRRMSAEQIWDSLVSLAGPATQEPPCRELPQVLPDTHALRMLGRGSRAWSSTASAPLSPTLARWLMNGPLSTTASGRGARLLEEMSALPSPEAGVEHAFLSILSRRPSPGEAAFALQAWQSSGSEGASTVVWALLNTSEFLFLH